MDFTFLFPIIIIPFGAFPLPPLFHSLSFARPHFSSIHRERILLRTSYTFFVAVARASNRNPPSQHFPFSYIFYQIQKSKLKFRPLSSRIARHFFCFMPVHLIREKPAPLSISTRPPLSSNYLLRQLIRYIIEMFRF